MWHRGMKLGNVIGKMAPIDFLVATNLQFVRNAISAKCNKMR